MKQHRISYVVALAIALTHSGCGRSERHSDNESRNMETPTIQADDQDQEAGLDHEPYASEFSAIRGMDQFVRLLEISNVKAFEYIVSQKLAQEYDGSRFIVPAFESWFMVDPDIAMSFAVSNLKGFIPKIRQQILRFLIRQDRRTLIQMLSASGGVSELEGSLDTVSLIRLLAATKPEEAAQRILSMERGRDRWNSASAIGAEWATRDFSSMLDWVENLEDTSDQSSAIVGAIAALTAAGDLTDVAQFISKIPKGELRDDAIAGNFHLFLEENFNEALKLAEEINGRGHVETAADDIAAYLEREGRTEELQGLLSTLKFGSFRDAVAGRVLTEAIQSDPNAAISLVQELGKDTAVRVNLSEIASAYSAFDPESGIIVSSFLPEDLRSGFESMLAESWSARNPSEAVDWLTGIADENGLGSLGGYIDGVLKGGVTWDAEGVFDDIANIGSEEVRSEIYVRAVDQLALFDPSFAAEKLGDVPSVSSDSGHVLRATRAVSREWLRADPIEASRWILELDQPAMRDVAISELAVDMVRTSGDIGGALEWVGQIQSKEVATAVLSRIERSVE